MNIQPPDNGNSKIPVQEDDAPSAKSSPRVQGRDYQPLEKNSRLALTSLDFQEFVKECTEILTDEEIADRKITKLSFGDVPKLDLTQTENKKPVSVRTQSSPHNIFSARLKRREHSPHQGSPPLQLSESPSRQHLKGSPKSPEETKKSSPKREKKNSPKSDSPLRESPKSEGRGSPKSPQEGQRRSRRLSIVALEFFPSSIVEHLMDEDILKLPESEASWRNKKEFPDDAIMNLPSASFSRVPLERIADMPPEKIRLMTIEQIKLTSLSQLQMLLSKHVKNLSLSCLAAIDLVQVKRMDRLFVAMTLCQDYIYNQLTDKQQTSLKTERRIYEIAYAIHTMPLSEIEALPFEVIDALPINLIESLERSRIITIFKTHWKQFNEDKANRLMEFVEKTDMRHFDPDLIVAKFANKENVSLSQKRLFENAGKRLQLRNAIRQFKPPYTGSLDPAEKVKFLIHFMTLDNVNGVLISSMKPHLYSEAMTMKDKEFDKVLNDFEAIGNLTCMPRPNKSYKPLLFIDVPDDTISSIHIDMRSYKPSNGPHENNHLIRLYSRNCTIAAGSLLPLIISEKDGATKRVGDPFADDMAFHKLTSETMTCLIFSGSDGRGWGLEAVKAAAYANQGFIYNACLHIKKGLKDLHELLNILAYSVKNAQQTIQQKTDGVTAHTGIIALRNPEGCWDILINSLGYSKVLFYNAKTKRCMELGPIRAKQEIFDKYPVGCLGKYFPSGDPDLKNYTLISLEAGDDDILIPMSKGIYYNLDPRNLGLTPQDTYNRIKANTHFGMPAEIDKASFIENKEVWNESVESDILRKTFIEMLATELISAALNANKADIAKSFAEHALQATKQTRIYMREHPDENMPLPGSTKTILEEGKGVEVMMKGYVDHISVAAIKLMK